MGSNNCPTGSVRMTSSGACQSAAAVLSMSFGGGGSWDAFPGGCLVDAKGALWFNGSPGAGQSTTRLLCASQGAAFPYTAACVARRVRALACACMCIDVASTHHGWVGWCTRTCVVRAQWRMGPTAHEHVHAAHPTDPAASFLRSQALHSSRQQHQHLPHRLREDRRRGAVC